MKKLLAAMAGMLVVTACAAEQSGPPKLTAKQAERIEKELAGLVPGEPVSCVSRTGRNELHAISDQVLIYRVSSNLIYRNDLQGRCSGIDRGDALVMRTITNQMCRGDIAQSMDLIAGVTSGSCSLGSFVPYRKPKS
jgi:hypothetical protein